jgi:hypothetical protein
MFPVEKEKCYLTIFGSDNSRLIPGQALSKPSIQDKSYVIWPYNTCGERIKVCQTSTYYVMYPEECQDATIPS